MSLGGLCQSPPGFKPRCDECDWPGCSHSCHSDKPESRAGTGRKGRGLDAGEGKLDPVASPANEVATRATAAKRPPGLTPLVESEVQSV